MQNLNGLSLTTPDCSSVVGQMYTNPKFQEIIKKIPASIRDDIKQEAALQLLEMPCPKVVTLFAQNNLLSYVRGICYHIAVDKRNPLSKHFNADQAKKANDYFLTTIELPSIPVSLGIEAQKILSEKNKNENEYVEQLVFNRYAELGSFRKVALYYNISRADVAKIVKKVKAELKCSLLQ